VAIGKGCTESVREVLGGDAPGYSSVPYELELCKAALGLIDDAIVIVDADGRIGTLNSAAEALLGWLDGEAKGLPTEAVFTLELPGGASEGGGQVARALSEGAAIHLGRGTMVVGTKGGEVSVVGTVAPVRDSRGEVAGAVMAIRKNVADGESLRLLRQDARKFQASFEQSPVGKSMTGIDGSMRVNRAFCELVGYSPEELQRLTWQDITHPNDVRASEEAITELKDGRTQRARFEKRYLHKSGQVVWAEVATALLRDAQGRPEFFVTSALDITARKRLEEEIESLARFPAENPNPVLRVRDDGTILYANSSSKGLLAYWGTAVGQSMPATLGTLFAEAVSTGREVAVDANCGARVFSLQLVPVRGAGYLNVYGQDKTLRARAEAEVREGEARYRSLFEGMLNGLAYCRMLYEQGKPRDFVYLAVNAAFETLSGLRNVVDKRVSEVIPGFREADAELLDVCGRVAAGGPPERLEAYVTSLKMWFLFSVYSPRPEHFVVIFDVITERKRMELEHAAVVKLLSMVNDSQGTADLLEAAARFFQEESGCEAVAIRLREGEDYPYVVACGFSAAFVKNESSLCDRGADGRLVLDEAGKPTIVCMCGKVIAGLTDEAKPYFTQQGSFWTNGGAELAATLAEEDRPTRPRGRCIGEGFQSIALIPLRVGNDRLGLLQLNDRGRDVLTPESMMLLERLAGHLAVALAKARAEASLRRHRDELETRVADRTRKLEEANREMESFAYSVSHDLRAPLRAIDGFTRILLDEHGGGLAAEGVRVCGVIRDNTERMGQLIDDLLMLSRLGRADMRLVEVDMLAMARAVWDGLATADGRTRIVFRLGHLPASVADASLMRQVWQNLLSNSVKFSAHRDQPVIEVDGEVGEREIVYSVKDNGAGFDPRYGHKLFGVFERLHSSREFEGTGVGLALVAQVLRRHGGRVWAEGAIDRGATFHFALPRREP
jgi:PAS domain S-box-containing protein